MSLPSSTSFSQLSQELIRQTEFCGENGKTRAFYCDLVQTLQQTPQKVLKERQERVANLARELGIHFSPHRDGQVTDHNWQLDIIPRLIDPAEWRVIEAGLIQRMRAFNALLDDIYHQRSILKDRIIPFQLIYDDPAHLLPCHGIQQPGNIHLTLGAVDMVRDRRGRWVITSNHYSLPNGLSFVLQNRRMLTQSFPEIFHPVPIVPVTGFTSDLAETLSALSPVSKPLVVMLTLSRDHRHWFEESFLARRMGFPLVEPGDLLVRDNRVYLKTVGGLERVDVIYRRAPSRLLDPIAFRSARGSGIPGLLNCVRKGSVVIANAFGAGVADNKALLSYSDAIIRYYLGEAPILPTATTYWCRDRDQLEYVKSHPGTMVLKPIHRHVETAPANGLEVSDQYDYLKKMDLMLEQSPDLVVAQPYIDASCAPLYQDGKFWSRPAYLRAFCLIGTKASVLPGGLTRQALPGESHHYIADLAGGAKDTWIPAFGTSTPVPSNQALQLARKRVEEKPFRTTSRVAEQLYWTGRYLERAEHTARMIRILLELGWNSLSTREKLNRWPLWQGVAASTGHEDLTKSKKPPTETLPIARELVLHSEKASSILNCVRFASRNASEIREFLTPEVWSVLNRFLLRLEDTPHKTRISATRLQDVCLETTEHVALINGTISRTMPHDDGWQAFRCGVLLERALGTATVLGIVLPQAILFHSHDHDQDPDLTSLLRMLGSLDAYQREYRSRAYLRQVAELLWKKNDIPGSILYCLRELSQHLTALEEKARLKSTRSPLHRTRRLEKALDTLDTFPLFPRRNLDSDLMESNLKKENQPMSRSVQQLGQRWIAELAALHDLIEDAFFSHLPGTARHLGRRTKP